MIGAGEVEVTVIRAGDNHQIDSGDTRETVGNIEEVSDLERGDIVIVDGYWAAYDGTTDLQEFLRGLRNQAVVEPGDNLTPEQARTQGNDLLRQMAETYRSLQQAQDGAGQLSPGTQTTDMVQARVQELRDRLREQIRNMQQLNTQAGHQDINVGIPQEYLNAAGMDQNSQGEGRGTATAAMTATPQQQAAGQTRAITGTPLPQSGNFAAPSGWGAQTAMPKFSSDAYMKSVAMGDSIMGSFDQVFQAQNQGKKLMMLFFYFARMAESGDMGAMYQFMKFLTYIISKDKAKQQIEMGTKLIDLQNLSREWTNKLLNLQQDASDPNSSNEFMKVMTQVKSETDAIATSQKLISQMMEEMAQVVETLTNATRSALEANGRILRALAMR